MTSRVQSFNRRFRLRWLLLYLLALTASYGVRIWRDAVPTPLPEQQTLHLARGNGEKARRSLRMTYVDLPATNPVAPVVLLLHDAPASAYDMRKIATALQGAVRVIALDLPGFGNSSRRIKNYGIEAQAARVDRFLAERSIERVHLLGFGLGGGVAIELADRDPQRVASLTLLASVGTQEMDLLGTYTLNHVLHGIQLAGVWTMVNAVPHFGALDHRMVNVPYARSLYDTDLRPLREALMRIEAPALILHSEDDALVAPAAARENNRLLPQSELVMFSGSHHETYQYSREIAANVLNFISRVEEGVATDRAHATSERLELAAQPFGEVHRRPASGIALAIVLALICVGTLFSEDLACIGAGVLVAHGLVKFPDAATAAFIGIFCGDVLLYLAGRYIGRPLLSRVPFRWFVRERAIQDSAEWFARRGPIVILASRLVPGSRVPTYFTAGLLRQHFWKYLAYFFVAGAVWAPMLVWLARTIGAQALDMLRSYKAYTLGGLLAVAVLFWLVVELLVPLCTLRGRRLLFGRWQRLRRIEFWPQWVVYLPMWLYIVRLAMRYGGAVFTASNPSIPAGGFAGAAKSEILKKLTVVAGSQVARWKRIPAGLKSEEAISQVEEFLQREGAPYPIVLKPDIGRHGVGVVIARTVHEVHRYFAVPRPATLAQEYISGREYDVAYFRYPSDKRGQISAIAEKKFPALTGDGRRSLEKLILRDPRTVCQAAWHLHRQRTRLSWVPAAGERVEVVEIGNRERGAIFRSATRLITPELIQALDEIVQGDDGLYLCRFELRAPSEDALRQGRGFKIIGVSGFTPEATGLCDRRRAMPDAWRILARHWRIAFEIGAANRDAGSEPMSLRDLFETMARHRPSQDAFL